MCDHSMNKLRVTLTGLCIYLYGSRSLTARSQKGRSQLKIRPLILSCQQVFDYKFYSFCKESLVKWMHQLIQFLISFQKFLKEILSFLFLLQLFCKVRPGIQQWVENNLTNIRIFCSDICISRLLALWYYTDCVDTDVCIRMFADVKWVGFLPPNLEPVETYQSNQIY